jgi:hypothetical protein
MAIIIAVLLLADFTVSKTEITERVITKKTQHQSYNNAGGNSHVSFRLITESKQFNCSASFFENLEKKSVIKIKESLLFNKVNSVLNVTTNQKETYSLRYTTGLGIPLIVLLLLILSLVKTKIPNILIFVTKVVIIADLVYVALF